MARGFRMGVGGGRPSRKTYTGTISSVGPYATETRYIGVAASTNINGLITGEYPVSLGVEYGIIKINVNGTDITIPGTAGARKDFLVNIPCNEGDAIILKATNNAGNYLFNNVTWTLTL